MKPDLNNLYKEASSVYTKYFSPIIKKTIDDQLSFVNTYSQILELFVLEVNSIKKPKETIEQIILHKKLALEFFSLNEEKFKKPAKDFFEYDLKTFNEKFESLLSTIDETVVDYQDASIFNIQKEDPISLKTKKRSLKSLRWMKGMAFRVTNLIGKIQKKPAAEYNKYRHTVPLRNLFDQYFRYSLMDKQLLLYGETKEKINGSVSCLMEFYDGFESLFREVLNDPEKHQKSLIVNEIDKIKVLMETETDELKTLKKNVGNSVKKNIKDMVPAFEKDYQIAGTIEYPASRLGQDRMARKKIEFENNYIRIAMGWENTLYAISEDWKFSLEIYILSYTAQIEKLLFMSNPELQSDQMILRDIEAVKKTLLQTRKIIEDTLPHKVEMEKVLSEQRIRLKELLENKLTRGIIDLLTEMNLPLMIDGLENEIQSSIDKVSKQRLIVRNLDVTEPLSKADFTFVSPQELISFEIFPDLTLALTKVKATITDKVNEFQNQVLSISQITDFNLESALSGINQEGLRSTSGKKVAIEGIDLAIGSIDEIRTGISELRNLANTSLQSAIDLFCKRIIKLSNTDNIFEIRLRIMKAKAIKRSVYYKEKVFGFANRMYGEIKTRVKSLSATGSEYTQQLIKLSGFEEEQISLMTEISHYLSNTEATVKNLPFVYQRLFRLEPLKDFRFLMGRVSEIDKLKEAYKNWKKGRHASVAITAEKGSGMTTLINYFLNSIEAEFHHIHLSDYDNPFEPENFMKILESKFEGSSIKHLEDAKVHLNDNKKKIIIIEGIQHLYLRKVNGFDSLKAFMELISETSNKVFWVCSCSLYAWEYLSKTINIWDYFGYVIRFNPLSETEIIDVIMKRHNVSGYKLDFDISIAEPDVKRFKNQTDEARYNLLKKEYFKKLNQFAKSNISLALLYWMQSAIKTGDNKITIGKIDKLNTQFMKYMRMEKVITMHLLLIHDGLTVDQYVSIMGQNTERCKLHLNQMYDDGILIKKAEMYLINPMLYRYTVNLLISKNIIL